MELLTIWVYSPSSVSDQCKLAKLIAFNSTQLSVVEQNYPIHKKELLAISGTLKKWRSDSLGLKFFVYTDLCTLKIFDSQKDLLWRQLFWQEWMSQFDMDIVYIKGEDNALVDACPMTDSLHKPHDNLAGQSINVV